MTPAALLLPLALCLPTPAQDSVGDEMVDLLRGLVEDGAYEDARNVAEEILADGVGPLVEGLDDSKTDAVLVALDDVLERLSHLPSLLTVREAMHAHRDAMFDDEHPYFLEALQKLADVHLMLEDTAAASPLVERVLAIRTKTLEPTDLLLIEAKQNVSAVRMALQDYEGAARLAEEVLVAREEILPDGDPAILEAMVNVAAARQMMGDQEGSLAILERAYAKFVELRPANDMERLVCALNVAGARSAVGDIEGALELEEEVHATWTEMLSADHPYLLAIKRNLAVTRQAAGDLDGALALEEEVLEILGRTLPPEHPEVLSMLFNLAITHFKRGDVESALECDRLVYEARASALPRAHPRMVRSTLHLAMMHIALGQKDEAVALSEEALEGVLGYLAQAISSPPREARFAVKRAMDDLDTARSSMELEGVSFHRGTFEVLETARHVATAPLYARIARDPTEETEALRARLDAAQAELDALVAAGPVIPDLAAWGADEEEATRRRDQAMRAWRDDIVAASVRRDAAQRGLMESVGDAPIPAIRVADVAAALHEGHYAVSIGRRETWRLDRDAREWSLVDVRYEALTVRSDGEVFASDLGLAGDIEALVLDWRQTIGAPVERGVDEAHDGVDEAGEAEVAVGRALRAALVDPWIRDAGVPKTGATVHLCLDEALHLVPIDALPLAEDEDAPEGVGGDVARLGDRLAIRNAVSFANLVAPDTRPLSPPSVLAVGAVDFDASPVGATRDAAPLPGEVAKGGERGADWGDWERLSATDAEVRELAFQADRELTVEAAVLRDANVTEAALREHARGKRYVHIATHGWFLPESIRSISDVDSEGGEGLDIDSVTGFAPLTLCGLVLSGANQADDRIERSGRLLTAQELAEFDLSGCELAILSACETNVGLRRAGQGIQSLQTALHLAGARASITSLWKVQDWPTQSLMKRFYDERWGKDRSIGDALWSAKCSLRREGHGPRIWAGWVLVGGTESTGR